MTDIIPPLSFAAPELSGGSTDTPPPARPSAITEDPGDEQDREDAFADEPAWQGKLLYPFSVERYSIFVSQRVSMGAPTLHDALRDGSAFYPDALRILFICSQLPRVLTALRRDPEAMQEAVDAWAEDNAPVHTGGAAVSLAIRLFNAANVNRHSPRSTAGDSGASPPKN